MATFLGKRFSFGQPCVLFVMSICSFASVRDHLFLQTVHRNRQSIEIWTYKSVNLQTCRTKTCEFSKTSKIAENDIYKPLCISLICI